MPSIVARPIPCQQSVCGGRQSGVCSTPVDSAGLTGCVFSCPTPLCPLHAQHVQLYCSEACFVATHAPQLNGNYKPPAAAVTAPSAAPAVAPPPAVRSAHSPAMVGKYILGRKLGQGTFGKVKLATHSDTGRLVALKMMDKKRISASGMGEQIKKEIAIMKSLQHRNIIELYEVLASPSTIYLVLELVTGGELFNVIVEQGRLEEDEAREYFSQLVSGLSYCHSRGVCHRDLKPENLLLDADGVLKISDFGLSALQSAQQQQQQQQHSASPPQSDSLTPLHLLHTTCGTPNYVAPEVLMDKGYDGKAADVWSAGVILYVLLAGFLPFDEISMVDLFRKIVKADFVYPAWFSAEAKDLLSRILTPKPEERLSMRDIQSHAWMTKGADEADADGDSADIAVPAASPTPSPRLSGVEAAVLPPPTSLGLSAAAAAAPGAAASTAITSSPVAAAASLTVPSVNRHSSDPAGVVTTPPSGSARSAASSESPLSSPSSSPSPSPSPGSSSASAAVRPADGMSPQDPADALLEMDEDEEEEELSARRPLSSSAAAPSASPSPSPAVLFGPRKMNAFDLINMVGGAAVNRMFVRGLVGRQRQVAATQFSSSQPPDVLLRRLAAVMREMEGVEFRVIDKYAQVRAVKDGARGKVALCCQVYEMTPQLFMLECRKMKGDLFVYYDFYREVKRRMEHKEREGRDTQALGRDRRTGSRRSSMDELKAAAAEAGPAGGEDGAAVIAASGRNLTITRPGSGSSLSGSSSGSSMSRSASNSSGSFRNKPLSILITPNTPTPAPHGDGEERKDEAAEAAADAGAADSSSLLYNATPNSSADDERSHRAGSVTPQPQQRRD